MNKNKHIDTLSFEAALLVNFDVVIRVVVSVRAETAWVVVSSLKKSLRILSSKFPVHTII